MTFHVTRCIDQEGRIKSALVEWKFSVPLDLEAIEEYVETMNSMEAEGSPHESESSEISFEKGVVSLFRSWVFLGLGYNNHSESINWMLMQTFGDFHEWAFWDFEEPMRITSSIEKVVEQIQEEDEKLPF